MATVCVAVVKSGFLANRPPKHDLFPLFYNEMPSLGPFPFGWTKAELEHIAELYALWQHGAMLLYTLWPTSSTWMSPEFRAFIEKLSARHFFNGSSSLSYIPAPEPLIPEQKLSPAPSEFVQKICRRLGTEPTKYISRVAAALYPYSSPSLPATHTSSNSTGEIEKGRRTVSIRARPLDGVNRAGLSEPHMYIYNVGETKKKVSGPVLDPPSDLELRYEHTQLGYMCRIPPEGVDIRVTFEGEVGISVFYRSEDTIVPTYDVMSRGFSSSANPGVLTTFAGPMNFNYSMSPDRFVVTKNFEYLPDYQFAFDGAEFEEAPAAPSDIVRDPVSINEYSEAMYNTAKRAGVTEPQSFIYRGLDTICPITTMAYLEPDVLPTQMFEASLDRMYARRGITMQDFVSVLGNPDTDPIEFKQMLIEAVDLVNTLTYRNDVIFKRETDVHQNIRLTNLGDCEDGAEAMFRIMRGLKLSKQGTREDVRALEAFFEKVTPMMMHMRISYAKSNSHSIAAGVVFSGPGVPDPRYQMFLMEGTGPEHANFCSVDKTKCDPAASAWRRGLARKISKDSPLQYYREPCDGTWRGDSFYKGFIGAVVDEDYKFFVEPGQTVASIKNNGVELCEVAMEGKYRLESAGTVTEAAKTEMRRLALYAPPLPEPGMGEFPLKYASYLERVKAKIQPRARGSGRGFTVFLNLCITEREFELALEDLEAIGSGSSGEVTGYATFPGTAIIEITIKQ